MMFKVDIHKSGVQGQDLLMDLCNHYDAKAGVSSFTDSGCGE